MSQRDPEEPVIKQVMVALKAGHRVWMAGNLKFPPGLKPMESKLEPAPLSRYGWNENAYETAWLSDLARAINTAAKKVERVPLNYEGPISEHENADFLVASGALQPLTMPGTK